MLLKKLNKKKAIGSEFAPLKTDTGAVIWVSEGSVILDTILIVFKEEVIAEEISVYSTN